MDVCGVAMHSYTRANEIGNLVRLEDKRAIGDWTKSKYGNGKFGRHSAVFRICIVYIPRILYIYIDTYMAFECEE